ncbi:DNA-binding MarR family transcriptional regulator [Bacteroides pyogenes]|nr:DNA-binding MarR family transcriptional regulator [Bacteroides pyogenes]
MNRNYPESRVYLQSCLNNHFMVEQFNFDIRLIFAILNGKVSAAINRKMHRNFRQNGLEISPEQWTVLIFLWKKDGITQQELCNATFKDKPSMTRLIDNMEKQHLVVRISDKKDRRTNLIHLTRNGKELEEKAHVIVNQTLREALQGITIEELSVGQEVLKKIFYNTKD